MPLPAPIPAPAAAAPIVRPRGRYQFPAPECPGYVRCEVWGADGQLIHFGYTLETVAALPETQAQAQAWTAAADPTQLRLVS